jgi:hypothetical protein
VFPVAALLVTLSLVSWPNFSVFAAHAREAVPFVIGFVAYVVMPSLFVVASLRRRPEKLSRR